MSHEFLPPDEDDVVEISEARATKRVVVVHKDGSKSRYLLIEMMNDGIAAWTKYEMTRVKFRNGAPDIKGSDFSDYYPRLIGMCLYNEDGSTPIPEKYIRENFPSRAQATLFGLCQTMNGLNAEGREAAKKD